MDPEQSTPVKCCRLIYDDLSQRLDKRKATTGIILAQIFIRENISFPLFL